MSSLISPGVSDAVTVTDVHDDVTVTDVDDDALIRLLVFSSHMKCDVGNEHG